MQKTRINWPWSPLYTWNPVTGCRRGCAWCYARRIHERFNPGVPFSDIVVHDDRFKDPMPKKRSAIFVGSMSDLEYWPEPALIGVLLLCHHYREHLFLFLSKGTDHYRTVQWPPNTMQGLTLTCEDQDVSKQTNAMLDIGCAPRPFLSIEPLLGCLRVNVPPIIDRVIVGVMTGPGAVPVRPEWVRSIKDNVPAEKIYWKQPGIAA